jgi:hypothetical protein
MQSLLDTTPAPIAYHDGLSSTPREVWRRRPRFPFLREGVQAPDAYPREHERTYVVLPDSFVPRRHELTSWSSGLTYTCDPSNAAWAKTNVTGTANVVANPNDGAVTAGRIFETVTNGAHTAARAYTFTAPSHAIQFFAKWLGRDWVRVLANDGTEDFEGWVNLATGATKLFADIINATTLNGGFETAGAPFGSWSTFTSGTGAVTRDTAIYRTGSASAKLAANGASNIAGVSLAAAQVGRSYLLGFWACSGSGTLTVRARLDTLGSFTDFSVGTTWTWCELTAVAGTATLQIVNYSVGDIYVDDVVLTPTSVMPIIAPGVLNGGFETAGGGGADVFANWTESGNGSGTSTITDETTIVHTGGHACKLTIDSGGNWRGVQTTVLQSGRRYRLTLWARDGGVPASLKAYQLNGQTFATFNLGATYAQYSVEFTANGSDLLLFSDSASVEVYLDDVTLCPLDPPEIVCTACPDSPAGDWWRIALILPQPRAAAGTVTLALSSDGTALSYAGDTAKGLYLKWLNVRAGTASTLGPAVDALGSVRTVLAPDLDADDPFAYLVDESPLEITPLGRGRFTRTFARLPGVQTSYGFTAFSRPNMSGLKSGDILAASLDDGRSVHLWNVTTQLKQVLGAENSEGTIITNTLPSGNITFTLTDTTAVSVAANASQATINAALQAAFVATGKLTNIYCVSDGTTVGFFWGYLVSGPRMSTIVNPSGTTLTWIQGNTAAQVKAFGTTILPDTKLIYAPSHGAGVGDVMALISGFTYMARATAAGISNTDYLALVLEDLKSVDVPISHLARAAAATVRYAVGSRDIRVRRQVTYYLPGVSMLADGTTLASAASLPASTTYTEGQSWLDQLVAAATHTPIQADDVDYLGPIVGRQVTAAVMAEAVDSLALV